jgi:type IV secretion system protein VirD4
MAVTAGAMFCLVSVASMRRRRPIRHEEVHGSARFATEREIRAAGLLPRQRGANHGGVYVGGWRDGRGRLHYLRHDGPEHVAAIAPTRSGKGVGLVLPSLLSWPASCVVYDEKAELWNLTAGWRSRDAGNIVLRWQPGAVEGSACFNFLDEVRLGTPYEVADAQNIAIMLCDPRGRGLADHWQKTAYSLLTGLILHVLYTARTAGGSASLADIAGALSEPTREPDDLYAEMVANRHRDGERHAVVAATGRDMLNRVDRERSGVHSTAVTYLEVFRDPLIARNTSRSDFHILDLMNDERPVSLYLVTPGDDKLRLRPLVRLLLTMVMRRLTGTELAVAHGQPLPPHRHRLLLMLDEFPSLGQLEVIEDGLAKCAGYGIKAFLIMQDREQLLKAYGPHENILANCHLRVVYAPNTVETARWISEMAGTATIVKEDVSESGPRMGSMKTVSRSFRETSRPLITADEVMRLKAPEKDESGRITESGDMLIFPAGMAPIRGRQILYFRDPVFSQRAAIPPPASGTTRPLSQAAQPPFEVA